MAKVIIYKGGKGSGNFDHAGRPGYVGGSSNADAHNSIDYVRYRYTYGKLLNKLKRFYRDDEKGLPHYEDDLMDIGNDLADALLDFGPYSNAWKYDEGEFDVFVNKLRTNPSAVDIDFAVDSIHQSLLEDDNESALLEYANDFKDYILNRDAIQEDFNEQMDN